MTKQKVRAGDLVIDPKLLELRPINIYYVSTYRQAARSGAVFPPVIIEQKTKRVVSGNHRVTMYMEEFGPDHEIEVIAEKFKDEASVIRRFAEENSAHGAPLSGFSQKAIAQKLLKYGDEPEVIAKVLNIPVGKIKRLAEFTVVVIGNGKTKNNRPIKRGAESIIGKEIPQKKYNEHVRRDRGVPVCSMASQIVRWINNGWIDVTDEKTMSSLQELSDAINKILEKVAA